MVSCTCLRSSAITTVSFDVEGDCGLNSKSLQDLQRFIVCGLAGQGKVFNNDEKSCLKTVIGCSSYSARSSLVFKASIPCRLGADQH